MARRGKGAQKSGKSGRDGRGRETQDPYSEVGPGTGVRRDGAWQWLEDNRGMPGNEVPGGMGLSLERSPSSSERGLRGREAGEAGIGDQR